MANYPQAKDNLPVDSTNTTPSVDRHPDLHNRTNDAVNAIENTLGLNPQGGFGTVADRLANVLGGRYLGSFGDLAAGTPVSENDIVTFDDHLYGRLANGVVGAAFDTANWMLLGTPEEDLISLIASKLNSSEKGQPNGVATLNATGKVPNTQLPPVIADRPALLPYSIDDPIVVGIGTRRIYMPTAGQIQSVEASVGTPPVGTPILVDVNKNGSTIFTTQPNRPQIPINVHTSGRKVPNVPAFAQGDYLTIDVDQIGSEPDAAVSFISLESTGSGGASVPTFNVTRPAAAQIGDVTLVCFFSQHATVEMWTPPAGSGWQAITPAIAGSAVRMHWFYRVDDGAPGPWTFTAANSHIVLALRKLTYRGAHQTSPIDSFEMYSTGGSTLGAWPIGDLEIINDDATEILAVFQTTNSSIPLPAGFTNRANFGASSLYAFADRQHELAGIQAPLTINPAPASGGQAARIALRPAPLGTFTPGEELSVLIRYLEV